jgi:RNA polymerase sigma factor (sigma-70 family)
MNTDQQLLEDYTSRGTDDAFTTLVKRYVDLVYSAALRQVYDPAMAQDVTQAVFIILSRKGRHLSPNTVIAGWLVRTTRFASLRALRAEYRRRRTEQKAFVMNLEPEGESPGWEQIAPLLDHAVAKLSDKDRNAVVLRYFENKSFAEVAAGIGGSEDAAKKRVARALERLRATFAGRRAPLPLASLAALLSNQTVQSAPTELSGQILAHSSTVAAAAATVSLVVKETLRAMFWAKVQIAGTVAALVVLAAGTLGMAVFSANEAYPKTPKETLRYLAKTFSEGDGVRFGKALHLTIDQSPELAAPWLPIVEKLVVAQASFRKAATERFGTNEVQAAMPFWKSLDELMRALTESQERIDGPQAKFPITMFGQTFAEVPVLFRTNGQWKFPMDVHFKSGANIRGRNNNNLAMAFRGNGLYLGWSTKGELDTQRVRERVGAWADLMSRVAADVRAGKFASSTEAWSVCATNLESIASPN